VLSRRPDIGEDGHQGDLLTAEGGSKQAPGELVTRTESVI
jgi:hypothetical protein